MELSIFGNRKIELKKSINYLDTHIVKITTGDKGAIIQSLGVFWEIITDTDFLTLRKGIKIAQIEKFNSLVQKWITDYQKHAIRKINFIDWIEGSYSDSLKWKLIIAVIKFIDKTKHSIKYDDKLVKFSTFRGSFYLYHNPMVLYMIVLGLQGFFIESYSLSNRGLK